MRLFFGILAAFAMSGCFSTAMGLRSRSGSMIYEAEGLFGPTPMEAASADLMSAQADMVRAQAQTMQTHPEMFTGWRGGYYGGYGYGGYGRVDPSYYYPPSYGQPASASTCGQAAADLDRMLRGHIAEEGSQP